MSIKNRGSKLYKNDGFSLVEIMIAIALLGGVTIIFLHLTDNIKKTEQAMLSTIDASDSVMIRVCRSLGTTYDAKNSKCELNINSPEMNSMKDIKLDSAQMEELMKNMQKMFQ